MDSLKNKVIFITGGTGSLGKAITNRLLKFNCKVVVFSRDEGKQALEVPNHPSIKKIIGDIRDFQKLDSAIKRTAPDYIIHTAALKRVDDMELYPDECVKTNVNGSDNVALAALNNKVQKCILVSTDKACQPINVYGSSKFIAERIFSNYDYNSDSTIFSSVRYGNVIASRGSFIPLFSKWIVDEKLIEVTSAEMTRFLFTLEDAVDAVLGALVNSVGGEVFVPQIDSFTLPMVIDALGTILNKQPKTTLMGLRPGEKLHEDMLAKTELDYTYEVDGINLLQIRPQFSNPRVIYQDFKKYTGPEFNSLLWVNNNKEELISLINRGVNLNEVI